MQSRQNKSGSRSLDSLLVALETLRRAPDGASLLTQIERGHRIQSELNDMLERAFVAFVQDALHRYKRRASMDLTTRLKVNLVAHQASARLNDDSLIPSENPDATLPQDAEALKQHLAAILWSAGESSVRGTETAGNERSPSGKAPATSTADEIKAPLQTVLQRLDEAMVHSADNNVRLKIIADAIERAATEEELEDAQELFYNGVLEMIQDNDLLDDRLLQARYHANEIAYRLATPIVQNGQTAERNVLLHRLEAEARRAERHRHPLTLALLGPDHLRDIERLVGPNAGREVVRRYVENISACARKYDLVTLCQPYGLAWVLPGAEEPQALQALQKVQRQIADSQYEYGGRLRPLPTFSGAVIGYKRGESTSIFLARAETLITRAHEAGPNRIETETSGTAATN